MTELNGTAEPTTTTNVRPKDPANIVSSEPLRTWLKSNDLTFAAAAELLGASPSGIKGWIDKGQMPRMARLALEGLERRHRAAPETVFLIRAGAKTNALREILKAMSIEHLEV